MWLVPAWGWLATNTGEIQQRKPCWAFCWRTTVWGQHQLLFGAPQDVTPGEWTLEWVLDGQLHTLDRILLARERGMPWPAKVVMLYHKAPPCIQRTNRAHAICRCMGWLPLNVCKTIDTVVSTECTEKGNPSYTYGIFSAPKEYTWLCGTNLEPYLPYGGVPIYFRVSSNGQNLYLELPTVPHNLLAMWTCWTCSMSWWELDESSHQWHITPGIMCNISQRSWNTNAKNICSYIYAQKIHAHYLQ